MSIIRKNVNKNLIHKRTSKRGNTFYSVSFQMPETKKWASFIVWKESLIKIPDNDECLDVLVARDNDATVQISYNENGNWVRKDVPANSLGEVSDYEPPRKQNRLPAEYSCSFGSLSGISRRWIHERKDRDTGEVTYSIGIPTKESDSGWGNINVNDQSQISNYFDAFGKDDDRFAVVKLANSDDEPVNVIIKVNGAYVVEKKTLKEIVDILRENQAEYNKKHGLKSVDEMSSEYVASLEAKQKQLDEAFAKQAAADEEKIEKKMSEQTESEQAQPEQPG